ncbi:MAG: 3-deoxy-manno-octulosonate cytidylyltransferase [Sulfuriflexus sp.]|nr:3-deoxy-manno-octulosonate cytidylyltransferase [Sulfuriflexus sp.]
MKFTVIIPARYASTRLPGKALLDICGKPMIQHVYERAVESGAEAVYIATDDERIQAVAEEFGAQVIITAATHKSGTDRLAEAVKNLSLDEDEIVVNLQGDEPLMPASLIEQVSRDLHQHTDASMATLCTPIISAEDVANPNVVKVVFSKAGYALYFSRAPIAWEREHFRVSSFRPSGHHMHYRHIGLYAYRAGFLGRFINWPVCDMEEMESLEQLRVLWNDERIHISEALAIPPPGVDTQEELERVRRLISQ